jgi:hypothetical protein
VLMPVQRAKLEFVGQLTLDFRLLRAQPHIVSPIMSQRALPIRHVNCYGMA